LALSAAGTATRLGRRPSGPTDALRLRAAPSCHSGGAEDGGARSYLNPRMSCVPNSWKYRSRFLSAVGNWLAYITADGPSLSTISCSSHALRFIASTNGPSSRIPDAPFNLHPRQVACDASSESLPYSAAVSFRYRRRAHRAPFVFALDRIAWLRCPVGPFQTEIFSGDVRK
jgi:hypothetical protein